MLGVMKKVGAWIAKLYLPFQDPGFLPDGRRVRIDSWSNVSASFKSYCSLKGPILIIVFVIACVYFLIFFQANIVSTVINQPGAATYYSTWVGSMLLTRRANT